VVLNLAARRNLELRICSLFRSFITDWCGYELAVCLTAEVSGRPQSFVRAVLERHNA
jgi:hypothetical protein